MVNEFQGRRTSLDRAAWIRRLHAHKTPIREIVRVVGADRNTVRKIIRDKKAP